MFSQDFKCLEGRNGEIKKLTGEREDEEKEIRKWEHGCQHEKRLSD
jgi:hypothetical protein